MGCIDKIFSLLVVLKKNFFFLFKIQKFFIINATLDTLTTYCFFFINLSLCRLRKNEFIKLGGDDINSKELRSFEDNDSESDSAWTDKNVSKYPKFYNSEITNELTNVGLFFDKNNQYNDKISDNTDVLISDSCYESKNGQHFCEDNTRLQNIPPSLITDINKCEILNSIGVYKDKILKIPSNERTLNGGLFYNEVYASDKINEFPSENLKPLIGDCSI